MLAQSYLVCKTLYYLVEQSSGKSQIYGLCAYWNIFFCFPIPEDGFIGHTAECVSGMGLLTMNPAQIMYNQLTLQLHRKVQFPRWVFWDWIFTAISQTNTLEKTLNIFCCCVLMLLWALMHTVNPSNCVESKHQPIIASSLTMTFLCYTLLFRGQPNLWIFEHELQCSSHIAGTISQRQRGPSLH